MGREVFARQKMTHHFTCPTSTADKAQNMINMNDEIKPFLPTTSYEAQRKEKKVNLNQFSKKLIRQKTNTW